MLLTDSIINVIIDVDRSPNFRMSQPTKPLGSRINSLAGSLHRQHQTRNQIGESIERQKYGKVERLQPRHVEEILGENRVFDYSKIPDALLKNLPRGRECAASRQPASRSGAGRHPNDRYCLCCPASRRAPW